MLGLRISIQLMVPASPDGYGFLTEPNVVTNSVVPFCERKSIKQNIVRGCAELLIFSPKFLESLATCWLSRLQHRHILELNLLTIDTANDFTNAYGFIG